MTAPVPHSPMYAYLLGMYLRGVLTDPALDAAVAKKWVTADEAAEIRAAKAAQDAAVIAAADNATTDALATPAE